MRAISVLVYFSGTCLLASQFGIGYSDDRVECTQIICRQKKELLTCDASIIMITNVQSSAGERDDVMLKNVKRACMGKRSCDVSMVCKSREGRPVSVSYLCVHDSLEKKHCTGFPVRLSKPHGFLQNPDYPAAGQFKDCRWRIEPEPSSAVHLTLHDLAFANSRQGICEGGLRIDAVRCDSDKASYTRLMCANDSAAASDSEDYGSQLTMVSCGPVDVALTPAREYYPLRFWLGYSVRDSLITEQPVSKRLLTAGLLSSCPLLSVPVLKTIPATVAMTTAFNQSVTSASGESDDAGPSQQDKTTTVLIVLVCVIGFIALTLTVVLVIVCIRRRRPKVELIEHVYAVPSTCQTLSHNYLADIPPDPVPRPRLMEPYSDVADARPPDQPLQATPTSPAYAEVEEVEDHPDANRDAASKRFQFPFRSRLSVSSIGTGSAHYEDVGPSRHNSTPATKNSTAAVSKKSARKNSCDTRAAAGDSIPKRKNSGQFDWTSADRTLLNDQQAGDCCHQSDCASSVYVQVMDGTDVKPGGCSPAKTSSSKEPADMKTISSLAAKYSAATVDNTKQLKVDTRERTSARLYPLQEGRVASLVSTLNRNKAAKNGVASTKGQEQVS